MIRCLASLQQTCCWRQRLSVVMRVILVRWTMLTWWPVMLICGRLIAASMIFPMEWMFFHWTHSAAGRSGTGQRNTKWYQWQTSVHVLQHGETSLTGTIKLDALSLRIASEYRQLTFIFSNCMSVTVPDRDNFGRHDRACISVLRKYMYVVRGYVWYVLFQIYVCRPTLKYAISPYVKIRCEVT